MGSRQNCLHEQGLLDDHLTDHAKLTCFINISNANDMKDFINISNAI